MRVYGSHDVWCSDVALKQVFSDLFLIAENKDASINSYLGYSEDGLNLSFMPPIS